MDSAQTVNNEPHALNTTFCGEENVWRKLCPQGLRVHLEIKEIES